MTLGQWIDILMLAGINGLFALGLYIQMRSGQLSIASGALLGVGAIASVRLSEAGLPFLLAVAAAGVVAALVGAAICYPCMRLSGLYLSVATIAFAEILRVFSTNVDWLGGSVGLHDIAVRTAWWHVALVVLLVGGWLARHERSVMGMRWDSLREAPVAAEITGIEAAPHRLAAFTAGAAILGIGGALLVNYVGFLSPDSYGYEMGVQVLLFVQLGGLGSVVRPLLGAVVVTVLLELLRPFAENRMLVYAVVLIGLVIWRTRRLTTRQSAAA